MTETIGVAYKPVEWILALSAVLQPAFAQADELCGREFASQQQIYSELTQSPDVRRLLANDRCVVLADEKNKTVWTFTNASVPGGPAAIMCKRPVQAGDIIEVQTQARCAG